MGRADRQAGVYVITCVPTGHRYVGATVGLERRRGQHFTCLRGGYHGNPRLQALYDDHGAEAFRWEVVELVDTEAPAYFLRMSNAEAAWRATFEAERPGSVISGKCRYGVPRVRW